MLMQGGGREVAVEAVPVPARFSWRRLPWGFELLSIGLGYGFYSVVRALSPQNLQESYENAALVVGWERALGILGEVHFNTFLSRHDLLTISASYYYATLHFVVTPLVLMWLFYRRKQFYAPLRSSLVIGTLVALVIYAFWPLAPPRFALPGVIDSVTLHPVLWDGGHGVEGFINELAAMPSLHVGWAVWVAFAIVAVTRSRWRHLAWLYPALTTVVVVATANHYLLDAVGGALVILIPLKLCGMARDMAVNYPPERLSSPEAPTGTAGWRGLIGSTRT